MAVLDPGFFSYYRQLEQDIARLGDVDTAVRIANDTVDKLEKNIKHQKGELKKNTDKQKERINRISLCKTSWFYGITAFQPQTWFKGGIPGKIKRQEEKLEKDREREPHIKESIARTETELQPALQHQSAMEGAQEYKEGLEKKHEEMFETAVSQNKTDTYRELEEKLEKLADKIKFAKKNRKPVEEAESLAEEAIRQFRKALKDIDDAEEKNDRAIREMKEAREAEEQADEAEEEAEEAEEEAEEYEEEADEAEEDAEDYADEADEAGEERRRKREEKLRRKEERARDKEEILRRKEERARQREENLRNKEERLRQMEEEHKEKEERYQRERDAELREAAREADRGSKLLNDAVHKVPVEVREKFEETCEGLRFQHFPSLETNEDDDNVEALLEFFMDDDEVDALENVKSGQVVKKNKAMVRKFIHKAEGQESLLHGLQKHLKDYEEEKEEKKQKKEKELKSEKNSIFVNIEAFVMANSQAPSVPNYPSPVGAPSPPDYPSPSGPPPAV